MKKENKNVGVGSLKFVPIVIIKKKTSRKRSCTSVCFAAENYNSAVSIQHHSSWNFLLISTTETASTVVVVDVEEEFVEAGDILSAFKACGGSFIFGGSTKLFPTSCSHLSPVSDDGVHRSNSIPESGDTPVAALANCAIYPLDCIHLQSVDIQLHENFDDPQGPIEISGLVTVVILITPPPPPL